MQKQLLEGSKLRTFPYLSYFSLAEDFLGPIRERRVAAQQALFIVKDGSDIQLQNSLSSALQVHKFNKISADLFYQKKIDALIAPFDRLPELDLFSFPFTYRVALIGSFTADEIELVEKYFGYNFLTILILYVADAEAYKILITEARNALPAFTAQGIDSSDFSTKLVELREELILEQQKASRTGIFEPFNSDIVSKVIKECRILDSVANSLVGTLSYSLPAEALIVPFAKKSFTHLCAAHLTSITRMRERLSDSCLDEVWSDLLNRPKAPAQLVTSSVLLTVALGLEFLQVAIKQEQLPTNESLDLVLISEDKQRISYYSRYTCASMSYDCFSEALEMLQREDLQPHFERPLELKKLLGLLPQLLDLAKIYQNALW